MAIFTITIPKGKEKLMLDFLNERGCKILESSINAYEPNELSRKRPHKESPPESLPTNAPTQQGNYSSHERNRRKNKNLRH